MIRHEIRAHTAFVTIDNPPANTRTPDGLRAMEALVGTLNADRNVCGVAAFLGKRKAEWKND